MPGDSGGAVLVEGAQGQLYYLGFISAQQGLFPEIGASASERRWPPLSIRSSASLPNWVRSLGYVP